MNKQNAKDYLPLVQAMADGKTIQHRHNETCEWIDRHDTYLNAEPECYRIKPEPRTVPLGPEDVPPGSSVRCNIDPDSDWCAVINTSTCGVMVVSDNKEIITVSWDRLFLNSSIKRPGEDWKPCSKTIEE